MQRLLCLILAGLAAAFLVSCAAPESNTSQAPAATPTVAPTPTPEPTAAPLPEFDLLFTEVDVYMVAQVMEEECANVPSITRQAAVAWTICNRVDAGVGGSTIAEVCTYPNQYAYHPSTVPRESVLWLAEDVLTRWSMERAGIEDVGRVIPSDFAWFNGDGVENYFRNAYRGDYDIWDWSLPTPYES